MTINEDAYRYAIKSAQQYGKAEVGPLIGKLKALHKDTDVKEIMPIVIETIKKVNSMNKKEIDEAFSNFESGYELKPKPEREGLPELDWAENGEDVVTRYAPNPNGPFHLGNARAAFLSYAYAEKYHGKFILRFEDTDPKIKKPIENAEEVFREDLEWLGIEVKEVYYASDRLDKYVEYMRKLIEQGNAYVCKCESEKWRELIKQKKGCACREKNYEKQMREFDKMLSNELKEGEAVLRIKTDLQNPDPSVRDWWIARIIDHPKHPRIREGYHVWPSYMFQSGIDDHEMSVTFILRGQEHSQNETKQRYMYEYFGWKYPHAVHFGRLSIGDMVLSTSKISKGIEEGKYEGWDDIRLGTIKALRRKGFKPEALKKIITDSGLTTSDANISEAKLASYNKELIADEAKRTVYLADPVKLEVHLPNTLEAEKDGEKMTLRQGINEFYVSKSEISSAKDAIFRLRGAFNVRLTNKPTPNELVIQGEFAGTTIDKKKVVSWLIDPIDLVVKNADNSDEMGMIENQKLHKGQYLQLEKKGFYIIDSVSEKRPIAWFCHE